MRGNTTHETYVRPLPGPLWIGQRHCLAVFSQGGHRPLSLSTISAARALWHPSATNVEISCRDGKNGGSVGVAKPDEIVQVNLRITERVRLRLVRDAGKPGRFAQCGDDRPARSDRPSLAKVEEMVRRVVRTVQSIEKMLSAKGDEQ